MYSISPSSILHCLHSIFGKVQCICNPKKNSCRTCLEGAHLTAERYIFFSGSYLIFFILLCIFYIVLNESKICLYLIHNWACFQGKCHFHDEKDSIMGEWGVIPEIDGLRSSVCGDDIYWFFLLIQCEYHFTVIWLLRGTSPATSLLSSFHLTFKKVSWWDF